MPIDTVDALYEVVLPKLDGIKKSGAGYMARCPAHDDGSASLSLARGKEHPVLMHCHAGCSPEDILAKLDLGWEDLSKPREKTERDNWQGRRSGPLVQPGSARWSDVYPYVDENGRLLFQVCRSPEKKFLQRRPDPTARDGWSWKLGDTRRVPYRLPQVIEAVAGGKLVFICEGEKDVHTLEKHGLVATCNPGGAGKWKPEYNEFFRDAVVTIIADKDEPGQAHARQVRDSLTGVAAAIEIWEAKEGKDATDHVNAGHSLADMEVTWTSEKPVKADLAPDLWEFLAVEDEPYKWLIPDLLERGDRVLFTGFEGLGKSMVARQMAVAMAAGVHPFLHHRRINPVRVLVIDCENSERQGRRKYRQIADVTIKRDCRPAPGMLRLIHKPEGIDLTRADSEEWLMERVTAHKPDMLFIGPFYRLHNADIKDEMAARKTVAVLDKARTAADCALFIEAHAGHGEAGKSRSVRPVGSSLLLRWPEFGFGIAPSKDPKPGQPVMDVEIRHWRGMRDQRQWPGYLTWGDPGDWPWKVSLGVPDEPVTPGVIKPTGPSRWS
ncbi:AAA family ATPase [Micromonospora haikouensis]|uniref:AAA family ATPase n=1 Tax=Micromonospora haikouensis TaxID=686309 RepID=UPI0036B0167F